MRGSDSYLIELLMRKIEVLAKEIAEKNPVRILERIPVPPPAIAYPMTWVKLDKYVELSGDSADSVQSRRKAGKWLDGIHCKIVNGRLWINLPETQRWVEEWNSSESMLALNLSLNRVKK